MKMKAYASFDQYLAGQAPRNQGVIRALRKFVKRVAPQLQESVKWGNGCWVQGKAPVAYVYSAPDHVQFGFFGGSALRDPTRLLNGEGKFVRHIKVRKRSDIDERAFGYSSAKRRHQEPFRQRRRNDAPSLYASSCRAHHRWSHIEIVGALLGSNARIQSRRHTIVPAGVGCKPCHRLKIVTLPTHQPFGSVPCTTRPP